MTFRESLDLDRAAAESERILAAAAAEDARRDLDAQEERDALDATLAESDAALAELAEAGLERRPETKSAKSAATARAEYKSSGGARTLSIR